MTPNHSQETRRERLWRVISHFHFLFAPVSGNSFSKKVCQAKLEELKCFSASLKAETSRFGALAPVSIFVLMWMDELWRRY